LLFDGQDAGRHLMITLRVWFVMITMTTVLAGGTVWSAVVRPASSFPPVGPNTSVNDLLDAIPTPVEPRVDVYGNEIEDAVGDYRIDPGGDVYENHSPDTEVTRLNAPTM
jgi:hypothetical protein